jgi:hypothetical protein
MSDPLDYIRAQAEKELGHAIPDDEWTMDVRNLWKRRLFSKMYNTGAESFIKRLRSL